MYVLGLYVILLVHVSIFEIQYERSYIWIILCNNGFCIQNKIKSIFSYFFFFFFHFWVIGTSCREEITATVGGLFRGKVCKILNC